MDGGISYERNNGDCSDSEKDVSENIENKKSDATDEAENDYIGCGEKITTCWEKVNGDHIWFIYNEEGIPPLPSEDMLVPSFIDKIRFFRLLNNCLTKKERTLLGRGAYVHGIC